MHIVKPIYKKVIPLKVREQIWNSRHTKVDTSIDKSKLEQEEFVILNYCGLRLLLDNRSNTDLSIRLYQQFEKEQIDYFSSLWSAGSWKKKVFLDIGAHWGIYSLLAWKSGIFDEIHAFESDRYNYSQLLAQIFLNTAVDIDTVNKFASDKIGTVKTLKSILHPDYNRGGVGIVYDYPESDVWEVDCVTIDSYLSSKLTDECIVFAKIDVEGHQLSVLRGMESIIQNLNVLIQVEAFPQDEGDLYNYAGYQGLRIIKKIGVDHYLTNVKELI